MKARFTKMLAIALIACLALGAVPATAAVNATWAKRAIALISYFESRGDYGCAHNDTNGLPSLGFIQWNGNECMELLNRVIDEDEAQGKSILGDAFYQKVRGATKWSGKMTSAQLSAASKLLKTDAGIRVQDALAIKYVTNYIEKGMALGITDATALVYYADIRHQVGSGAIVKYQELAAKNAGSYGQIRLKHLYDAAMNYATHTKSRRKTAYEMLVKDPVSGGSDPGDQTGGEPGGQAVKPTGVSLGKGTVTLYMNETLTLAPTLAPENAVTTYTWNSRNRKVARVANGVVSPVKPGKATVRVRTANGLTASLKIRVKPVPVESIALTGNASLSIGDVVQLTAQVLPADATNKKVRFKSSKPKVVAISKDGKIKALKPGTATIACQSTDGTKRVGKLTVTVK